MSNIPFSLALRIVRICSDSVARDKRLEELECLLLARGYKAGLVKTAVDKARKIPRKEALKKVERNEGQQRPIFVIQYDPILTSITEITREINGQQGPTDARNLS